MLMGVMDSFEQLQAAKAECVRLERELADVRHRFIEEAKAAIAGEDTKGAGMIRVSYAWELLDDIAAADA